MTTTSCTRSDCVNGGCREGSGRQTRGFVESLDNIWADVEICDTRSKAVRQAESNWTI
jgi:hypothetical protein